MTATAAAAVGAGKTSWKALLLCCVLSSAFLFVHVSGGCTVVNPQCYVDDSGRILGNEDMNPSPEDGLYNEYCGQVCSDLGYKLAGTENGDQCFCGNSVRADAQKAPQTDCNTPCQRYPNENCGAGWRIWVFPVSCVPPADPGPPHDPKMVYPCRNASSPYASMPYCDSTLPISQRVDDAISRMTLTEKINNLGTDTLPIQSLGTAAYNWWSEATHGVASGRFDQTTPWTTNFAFPITTAMSFNRSLWQATGQQIGREARAMMNALNGYSTFWAPVVNLARDPRWGRNIETPGEDPYLSGEYATYFVKGFQESNDDTTHIQASACCKHFVANEMDDSTEVGVRHWRDEFDASVSLQDLSDSYLIPFQACVEKGRVSSLMCSYNAVNGIPSCANSWLLTTVARNEWNFDGYITSDCDADADVFSPHNYTATPEEAVRDVLQAGTDVDCGTFVQSNALSALKSGVISQADIDARLRYLFRVRMRLGHFDPPTALDKIPVSDICSPYALALSREGAAQSATLIQNNLNRLPLNAATIQTAAVIGPNALLSQSMAGYYGPSRACNMNFWTMVDAVQQYVPNTVTAPGVPDVSSDNTTLIAAAVALAQQVDVVILAVGTDLSVAAEGHDAVNITFSNGQIALISQVAAAVKQPVVVVTLTAVPLDLTPILSIPNIGAILHVGQPSVTTLGVGDVLFGKKSPAGRLVQTILPKSYQDQISIFDFNMRPGPSTYPRPDCTLPVQQCPMGTNPGRTNRFYTGQTVMPFGFGLSYTTFSYTPINNVQSLSLNRVKEFIDSTQQQQSWGAGSRTFPSMVEDMKLNSEAPLVVFSVNVTNTGNVPSDDVVLGFLVPPGAGVDGVPLQTLFAFERVFIKAGQTVTVSLMPSLTSFTQVNANGKRYVATGEYAVRFGVLETAQFGGGFAEHRLYTSLDSSSLLTAADA